MNRSPLREILRSEELRDKGKRDKDIGNNRAEVVYYLTEIISSTESISLEDGVMSGDKGQEGS